MTTTGDAKPAMEVRNIAHLEEKRTEETRARAVVIIISGVRTRITGAILKNHGTTARLSTCRETRDFQTSKRLGQLKTVFAHRLARMIKALVTTGATPKALVKAGTIAPNRRHTAAATR